MNDALVFVSSRAGDSTPADPRRIIPRTCPGLSLTETRIIWVDSLGEGHDLLREKRLSTGDVARQLNRSVEWVLRRLRDGTLFPAVWFNPRLIEVWQCAVDDYVARSLAASRPHR